MQLDENKINEILMEALGLALTRKQIDEMSHLSDLNRDELQQFIALADRHEVLPMLYDIFEQAKIPKDLMQYVSDRSRRMVLESYRLMQLAAYVTQFLQEEGITAIVLKGASTASLYPVPEVRKSSDVDLLLANPKEYEKACEIFLKKGFHLNDEEHSNHHKSFVTEEGVLVELHSLLVEPFESKAFNRYVQELTKTFETHVQENKHWGVTLYEPELIYHAYYLLLHMMQHFLRSGFGLRNLCDWVVILQQEFQNKEKEQLLKLLHDSGMQGFASCLTQIAVTYFGIEKESVEFLLCDDCDRKVSKELLFDILTGGEFGGADEGRMVLLRGRNVKDYLREFHHQMYLNYPNAGHIFLIWPILWGMTAIRFLHNNRQVRKISTTKILKDSRKRSTLFKSLHLKYH